MISFLERERENDNTIMYMYLYACKIFLLYCTELLSLLKPTSGIRIPPTRFNEPFLQGSGQPVNLEIWLRPCRQLIQIIGKIMLWCGSFYSFPFGRIFKD